MGINLAFKGLILIVVMFYSGDRPVPLCVVYSSVEYCKCTNAVACMPIKEVTTHKIRNTLCEKQNIDYNVSAGFKSLPYDKTLNSGNSVYNLTKKYFYSRLPGKSTNIKRYISVFQLITLN